MDIYEQCKVDAAKFATNKVVVLLEQLDKKEAQSLKKALLDPTIPTRAIERVLQANNIDCGMWAINSWRKKNGIKLTSTRSLKRDNK